MRKGSAKLTVAAALLVLLLLAAAPARGATRWSVRGAGFGHGVGMSQYGALGFARQGLNYRQILAHYYEGTRITRTGSRLVRVLLQPNRPTIAFTGATRAPGRRLNEGSVYKATRRGSEVLLRSSSGRPLGVYGGLLTVAGGNTIRLLGSADNGVRDGLYRGALDIRVAAGPGLNAINSLAMENYLQGVVPAESPPIWPAEALKAQAVAARSYAAVSTVSGRGFEQYADTRSQVYRGYLAETASTSNAVVTTGGEVVTYNGAVVVTYFFSTSGGYTENVENVFGAAPPSPWLRGVRDPYDDLSPYHRWGPYTWSRRLLQSKLGRYVKGRFRGIRVLERGVSPRVVKAQVRGSRGTVTVTGPQLRNRLELHDSWFYIRRVSTETGSAQARTSSGERELTTIYGTIEPSKERFAALMRRQGDDWVLVAKLPLDLHGRTGTYSFHVARAGDYRVLAGWAPGAVIRAR